MLFSMEKVIVKVWSNIVKGIALYPGGGTSG